MIDPKKREELKKKAHKLKITQDFLAQRWGVGRSAVANKFAGRISFMNNQLEDLKELIRQKENPIIKPLEQPYAPQQIETLFKIIEDLRNENRILKEKLEDCEKKILELTKPYDGIDRRKKNR